MEAKELRIGNLVYYENDKVTEEISTTNLIFIEYWNLNKGKNKTEPENRYKPIPLTEEWLFKFGFELNNKGWSKDNIDYFIEYNDNIFDVVAYSFYYIIAQIKYVHQLQNLYFALTGKELILK